MGTEDKKMKSFKAILSETLIDQAKTFAQFKHHYQTRKYSPEPYIVHPSRVSSIVSKYTKDPDIIAAAWCHDVLEDSDTTIKELEVTFNSRVAKIVKELTSDKDKISLVGKAEYLLKKMMKLSPEALLIKLVDRYDNTSDFAVSPKSFVDKYIKETHFILSNLKRPLSSSHLKVIKDIYKNIGKQDENL